MKAPVEVHVRIVVTRLSLRRCTSRRVATDQTRTDDNYNRVDDKSYEVFDESLAMRVNQRRTKLGWRSSDGGR